MGNQNISHVQGSPLSMEKYQKRKEYQLPWTANFTVYEAPDDKNHKKIIEKKLILQNGAEVQSLIKRFQTLQSSPFYLIKPLHIEIEETQTICVEPTNFLPSIEHRLQNNDSSITKQVTIWFIINQVCHSLQNLYDKHVTHLWISPETIFCNINENWLLQDMSFWWGYDIQSLLERKVNSKNQIISPSIKLNYHRRKIIDFQTAKDEDVYCLGYTILTIMTSLPFSVLCEVSHDILKKCHTNYTHKLISLISQMIEPNPSKRISFERLKLKLKLDEEEIIDSEIKQYKKSHYQADGRRMSQLTVFQPSILSPIKSPLQSKHHRFHTQQRTQTRSQVFLSPISDRTKLFTSPQPNHNFKRKKSINVKHFRLGSVPKRQQSNY